MGSRVPQPRLPLPWLNRGQLCWWGVPTRWVCRLVNARSCVCRHPTARTPLPLCFSNANLTRGLCVAAMARPTSTTVNCIEMPASQDPKSRLTTMGTAKVGSALTTPSQLQPWGAREQSSVAWFPGVLSTPTAAPKAVETTQVLGGVSSWHSRACSVHPGWPRPLPRVSCIRPSEGLPALSAAR